jgi:hypothetical protein
MLRPFIAVLLVASLPIVAHFNPAFGADAIEQARGLLSQDQGAAAASVLEGALATIPATRKAELLALLKDAYDRAARRAEAEGRAREAQAFRDNLAILNHRPGSAPRSVEPSQPPAAPVPVPRTATTAEPARATPPSRPSGNDGPIDVPMARPARIEPLQPGPPSEPTRAPEENEPSPARVDSAERPSAPPSELLAADEAFRAKRYQEAGRLYETLARGGKLPPSRTDHWAYCRCAEVVRRINARPAASDWPEIQAEIEEIRRLSPQMWFGEYLRNLASERKTQAQRRQPDGPHLRAASPDEDEPTPRPRRWRHQAYSAPGDDMVPPPPRPETVGNWRIKITANFRILHADPALAEEVARIAETVRDEQAHRWTGRPARVDWNPRCDVYLYPNGTIFAQQTGQPEDSPGFSTLGIHAGRVVARRLNLRADYPGLTSAVLPHEITHVVLADLFPTQAIPRWADEGMAVLAEPESEQQARAADLAQPLASGRLFPVDQLMSMDYPDGRFWGVYYAQSVSLTRFLVGLGSPARFVEFLQGSQRNGIEAELKRVYQIDGFGDLQRRWLDAVRTGPTRIAQAPETDGTRVR